MNNPSPAERGKLVVCPPGTSVDLSEAPNDQEKMVLIAVEVVPARSKPPAAVSVRISTGERRDFGAAAPLSTKVTSCDKGEPEVR